MFSGTTTKLSESVVASALSISPKTDLIRLSGNVAIATIVPPFGGSSGILFIVPTTAGGVATTTAGNIAAVVTMPINQVTVLVYSKTANKWYAGAIS